MSTFVPGFVVGKELLDALGLPSDHVLRITLDISGSVREPPTLTLVRAVTAEDSHAIREVLSRYHFLEMGANPPNGTEEKA